MSVIQGTGLPAGAALGSGIAIFEHQTATGVSGGTATSGSWLIRPLTIAVANGIVGASLAANKITLPAGDYWIEATSSFISCGYAQTRIYDFTASAEIALSLMNHHLSTNYFGEPNSILKALVSLSVESVLELQYQVGATESPDGLGPGTGYGAVNVHARVVVMKVAAA